MEYDCADCRVYFSVSLSRFEGAADLKGAFLVAQIVRRRADWRCIEYGNEMRRIVALHVLLRGARESHLRRCKLFLPSPLRLSGRLTVACEQSILLESMSWDHLRINASWLLGSGGTVFLDFIVLGESPLNPRNNAIIDDKLQVNSSITGMRGIELVWKSEGEYRWERVEV